jgi:hypothetical protein
VFAISPIWVFRSQSSNLGKPEVSYAQVRTPPRDGFLMATQLTSHLPLFQAATVVGSIAVVAALAVIAVAIYLGAVMLIRGENERDDRRSTTRSNRR